MYQGETLSLTRLDGDFLEINFNNQNGSVNKFDSQTLNELREAMVMLKQAESVKGLLLTSSKSVFVVGADITEFSVMFNATRDEFVAQAADVNECSPISKIYLIPPWRQLMDLLWVAG